MPPAAAALATIGGGSALAGGLMVGIPAALSVGAAALDRKSQKEAISSMEEQKALSQAFIEEQMKQARGDLFKLFPSIQDSQQKGLQSGLDLYKQTIPVQLNAFREGNVAAQQQLASGLPQVHNAILGRPIDYSGFQPRTIDGGIGGLKMPAAPQFQPIGGLGLQAPQSPQMSPAILNALAIAGIK